MNVVPKINNDPESQRLQRNMTDTQKKNSNSMKEGKIVNAFVKDPLLSLDETIDTLVISETSIDLPQKVFEKEDKKNTALLPICAATTGVMALLGGFTYMIKSFSKNRLESTKEYLLPGITRNHCINDEIHQSIFSMIQSPNRKTILASLGVITLGAMAFMGKVFIDGFKEVWVRRQEANIQKNLQENLIAVETQSFSGKNQIIRSMLSSKAKIFSSELKEMAFKGEGTNDKESKKTDSLMLSLIGIGVLTLGGILALGYFSMKNIRKSDEFIKKGIENTKTGLENLIKAFNEGKEINSVQNHEGQVLTGNDAYKHVMENMLESIYAKPAEIEGYVNKMNMSPQEKEEFIKYLKSSMNQATEKVNSAIGGSGRNKITYFSHVNDYLSFFYDWLMNPKNPQFKNLFFSCLWR